MVPGTMSKVRSQISISLDGFAAGANQSLDNPLGEGGERLHDWMTATDSWRAQHGQEGGARSVDSEVAEEVMQNAGAYVMGRNMFTAATHVKYSVSLRGSPRA